MDDAAYDSTDNLIIGVRGTRLFKCSPNDGSVTSTSDLTELGLSGACIVYNSGNNRCFVSAWNTGHFDTSLPGSSRNLYRIIPASLAVDLVSAFNTTFGIDTFATTDSPACGLTAMKNIGGEIYGLAWSTRFATAYFLHFTANNVASNTVAQVGAFGYPSVAYASVGGHPTLFVACPGLNQVVSWDFTSSSGNTSPVSAARGYTSIEYVPSVNQIYVAREFQFIDIYDTGLNYLSTIDTGRSTFQGVNMLLNPNDGLLYVAGGADNTVAVITPASSAFTIKTGFDLPWKFVFTPTKKFCVQQGSVGLKEIT